MPYGQRRGGDARPGSVEEAPGDAARGPARASNPAAIEVPRKIVAD